jgi:hypothetical protein
MTVLPYTASSIPPLQPFSALTTHISFITSDIILSRIILLVYSEIIFFELKYGKENALLTWRYISNYQSEGILTTVVTSDYRLLHGSSQTVVAVTRSQAKEQSFGLSSE